MRAQRAVAVTALAVREALNSGNVRRAQDLCARMLEAAPADTDALHLAGIVAYRQGRREEAVAFLARAADSDTDAQPSLGLGQVLLEYGRKEDAVHFLERAVDIDPVSYSARTALANALFKSGRLDDAQAHLRQALVSQPDGIEALELLSMVLCSQGRHAEARPIVLRMQRLQPRDGRSIFEALLIPAIHQSAQDIEETRAELIRRLDELLDGPPLTVGDPVREIGITPFYLAYHGLNDRDLQARIARLCRKAYRPAYSAPRAARRRSARIRIGFVSTYFNLHSIGMINRGFISRLRRDRFEVTVFSLSRHRDALARRIREESDHYVEFDGASLAHIESAIAEHALDVLFFTDVGMDPLTYFLAYSRLAPLQCVAWGHPDTTGIDTLDYFISAAALELPEADGHYTEKLARLPAWITPGYERPAPLVPAPSRREYGIRDDANVYVCTQHPFKIHHEFDEAMAGILRRDPNAEVVLVEGQHPHLTELLKSRFRRTIPDVSTRIRILPRMPWNQYLGLLQVSDVMIDSFHFSGGNTTYQSLGMGLPVVTLPATYLRGRHSLGCYLRMGMTECVATTPQHYVEIAVRLGTDPDYRKSLAAAVSEASAVLFDNYETVTALEDFLEEATTVAR